MSVEHMVRILAGTLILASLVLGLTVSFYWFILTGFVGLNLVQSAFTKFCPAEIILKKVVDAQE
jgi:hypothetical protein